MEVGGWGRVSRVSVMGLGWSWGAESPHSTARPGWAGGNGVGAQMDDAICAGACAAHEGRKCISSSRACHSHPHAHPSM
jgi:hypothetical protein